MWNRMLQAYVTVARWLTYLKKNCNILGFIEIKVYKIQPVGGGGVLVVKPYLPQGLTAVASNYTTICRICV